MKILCLLAVALGLVSAEDFSAFDRKRADGERDKTAAMLRQQQLIQLRYDFDLPSSGSVMSGGKAILRGPAVRASREGYRPLPHPIPEIGHFIFPDFYSTFHPELKRVDADFDLPVEVLPEYPPPLYLATRPDLGDVSQGMEVGVENYKTLLDKALTPQQLEGVRLMLIPRQTLWFNKTAHRMTEKPARGVTCFACHVNGHTNGAMMLEPSTRPNSARARVDTPSLRGVAQARLLGTKRALHSLGDFVAVEDYFEGELDLAKHIGALELSPSDITAISSFLSIIDFPPSKLGAEGRLDPSRAKPAELAGERLFFGKARCASCHPAPFFADGQMHDLRADRAFGGPPEGLFKTPTLRGIKDSPPYLHDGRLPTLEDAVGFFDGVLGLKLTAEEKRSLAAYLMTL